MGRADFDVVAMQPQYPLEARECVADKVEAYREMRRALVEEARVARLMQRAAGRRVSGAYGADLTRIRWAMLMERTIFWRTCNQMKTGSVV